jgi:hypothetical protein
MMAPFVVGASLPYLVLRVPRSALLATALAALSVETNHWFRGS